MSRPATSCGVPLDRVVAVLATLADGTEQLGSGYVVSPDVIVTAKHCTRDRATNESATTIRVVNAATGEVRDSLRVWNFPGLDIAALTSETGDTFHSDDVATTYGRVDRTRSGKLRDCVGIGFPRFQFDPRALTRGHSELHGVIYQTDESESGNLLLREPLLETVRIEESADGSTAWSGFSGAVVFRAGLALGVVVEHHRRQSSSSTQLVTFDQVALRSGRSERHREFRELLGVPDHADLAVALPESELSTDSSVLTAGEIFPFEFLDAHCSIFGPAMTRSLQPSYSEYAEGQVRIGRHGPELESLLADGSVLLRGRGAAGKTTVCAWVGVQHSLRAGDAYYLDLALLDGSDDLSVQAKVVDLVAKLATAHSILIVENTHRATALASTLYRQWIRIGAPGRLLMTERLVRNRRHHNEQSPIAELVDVAHELTTTTEDLVLTLERNAGIDAAKTGTLEIPHTTSAEWLALFAGDRMAFTLAVRKHLEAEGLEAWIRRGATLTADDSVAHILDEYIFRWPQARADLVRLAVGASLEIAVSEDALNLDALEAPLREGFVHRTVSERTAHRYYTLAHSGLGALVLSACRVESKADQLAVVLDIVRRSPATGYPLAGRLEAGGDVEEAVATLRACVQTVPGLVAGVQPTASSLNLKRFARYGIISLGRVDQVLSEPSNAPLSIAMIRRYPWMVALGHLRSIQRSLPRLFGLLTAELRPVLATPREISRLSEHLLTSVGDSISLLSYLPSLFPDVGYAISGAIARRLATPEGIDALADASLRALGDGVDFLVRFPKLLPGPGDVVVQAVIERWATPEYTDRVARACLSHLGNAVKFLNEVPELFPEAGRDIVEAVFERWNWPEEITLLADICLRDLSNGMDFLNQLSRLFPEVGATVVRAVIHQWTTAEYTDRVARACLNHLGYALRFFDQIPQLDPEIGRTLVDAVAAHWNTPSGITVLAEASLKHIGDAIDFFGRLSTLFPGVGSMTVHAVVERWRTEEDIDRLAEACLKNIGFAIHFFDGILRLMPGAGSLLADDVITLWNTPNGIERLADACLNHLGYAVEFLDRAPTLFADRGQTIAEAVLSNWNTPEGIELLSEQCLFHLGYAIDFFERTARRYPEVGMPLAGAILARWTTPGGLDRLASASLKHLGYTVEFIHRVPRLFPEHGRTLPQALFARWNTQEGIASLAELCMRHLGYAVDLFERAPSLFGEDGQALSEAIIHRWHGEDEIGRLAEGCLSHLGYAVMVLDRFPRLFPARGPDLLTAVAARWSSPTSFARLLSAVNRSVDRVAFVTHASRYWPQPGPSLLERMRDAASLDVLASPFATIAAMTGVNTLSDFSRLDQNLLHEVVRRIVAQHGPETIVRLAAAAMPRSGWLLEECESALPDIAKSVLPMLATTPTVESYLRSERASIRVADAFEALAVAARGAMPFAESRALELHRLLLDVFRQGWHLNARVRFVDLVRAIPAEETACLILSEELSASMEAAARSTTWLRREFAVTRRGPIIDAVFDLWWSGAERTDVRALTDDLLAERIQDDLVVLDLAKPTLEVGSDAVRLLGVARLYGVDVTVPAGLVSESTAESALENAESHRTRRQLLLGALWLHDHGYGRPAGVERFLPEVLAIDPCETRAEQAVVRELLVEFVRPPT